MTNQRLVTIHEQYPSLPGLDTYTRPCLVSVYDGLHAYHRFETLSHSHFPLLDAPLRSRGQRRELWNPDIDEDVVVDDSFFTTSNSEFMDIDDVQHMRRIQKQTTNAYQLEVPDEEDPIDKTMEEMNIPKVVIRNGKVIPIL
jgi:hypothetical protein